MLQKKLSSTIKKIIKNKKKSNNWLITQSNIEDRKIIKRSDHVAVTIVSKNYISYAKVLSDSYLKNHPNHDFIVVLVDRAEGLVAESFENGARIIELGNFNIPNIEVFIYRYSIMELNTAVKPYVLYELFTKLNYLTAVYLDPDIYVFKPLTHVYKQLEKNSIILTPHIRKPYNDEKFPSEKNILQSGIFNLGFIGLKKSVVTIEFLNWWMKKLYKDCIVDIPNGLFVDQKWIDLLPSFFSDYFILRHPGYNVAYWNLHERPLIQENRGWRSDGQELYFFHFSGFNPLDPHKLSKHQNRFTSSYGKSLFELTNYYASCLLENNYLKTSHYNYSFETLPNGVTIPLAIVNKIVRWAENNNVDMPLPLSSSDEFCAFLYSKDASLPYPNLPVFYNMILELRVDVVSAFPEIKGPNGVALFEKWLHTSGKEELKLNDALIHFVRDTESLNYVEDLFSKLYAANRVDVFTEFNLMWKHRKIFDDFCLWILNYGSIEHGFSVLHVKYLQNAYDKIGLILNIYFSRGDIQLNFPILKMDADLISFTTWCKVHCHDFNLKAADISLFEEFAKAEVLLIERMQFLYQHFGKEKNKPVVSIYDIDARRRFCGTSESAKNITQWLLNMESHGILSYDFFNDYIQHFGNITSPLKNISAFAIPGLEIEDSYKILNQVQKRFSSKTDSFELNIAGYLGTSSGVGEASRSMLTTLETTNVDFRALAIPNPNSFFSLGEYRENYFGEHFCRPDISILIANADVVNQTKTILPANFFGKRSIGYWVWETENFPEQYVSASESFDLIWSPSQYSADSISLATGKSVKVLPYTLNWDLIRTAKADRTKFKLPEHGLLFGFLCDPRSSFERKNIAGLITAFNKSFNDNDNAYLVIKILSRYGYGGYDFERIRAEQKSERIIFIYDDFDRLKTFDFIKSLDVYISLHRSEGFGLTLAESMALGIPVIASHYSGNLEFMSHENSFLIETKTIQTDRAFGPYAPGTIWGDPNIDAAGEIMRLMLNREFRQQYVSTAKKSIRQILNPSKLGKMSGSYLSKMTSKLD